jgi:membrane-bound lytic murein transglycosylase D
MCKRVPAAVLSLLLFTACAPLPPVEPEPVAPRAAETRETVAPGPAPRVVMLEPPEEPFPPHRTLVEAIPLPPPPPPVGDLWARVRAGFRLPDVDNRLVRSWERWYSSRPDYVELMAARGSHFLHYVVEAVERRGMPMEMALLPMVESAYNPRAYSRSHAAGIWQFIPSTGRIYGLRQSFWYDGRRDVIAATDAALEYLQALHGQFRRWDLALIAYNWGQGALGRAIARNRARGLPTDPASLAMPHETRNYLPKLQAVKNIIADPARFGLVLAKIPDEPYFATVVTRQDIDVELAARFAGITLEEFRFLNPAHRRPVIRADGAETIVLPRHTIGTFQKNLARHDEPLVTWQVYTVQWGDHPATIAQRHGISVDRLREVNGMSNRRYLIAGQAIVVPYRGEAEPHLPNLPGPRVRPVRYVNPKPAASGKPAPQSSAPRSM